MKILICDDDISTINVIEKQINWEKLGIDEVLRSYNGIMAKEIIEKERPDMILCDIEMPQCDGISVLKYISEHKIETQFTFLTCFESFEYAREAVRFGANNYLTKPLDLEELEETLKAMVSAAWEKVAERERRSANVPAKNARINYVLQSLKDGIYGTDYQRINEMLERERLPMRAESLWRIVLVSSDMTSQSDQKWEPGLLRYGYRYLAQETITDRINSSYMLADSGERFDYLLLFVEAKRFSDSDLEQRCNRLIRTCHTQMGITPVCLIGKPAPLGQTAQVANDLRKQARTLRMDTGKVYFHRNLSSHMEKQADWDGVLDDKKIISALKLHKKEQFMQLMEKAASHCQKGGMNIERNVAKLHHDLLQTFYSCLRDNNIQAHALFRDPKMQELSAYSERSIPDMLQFAAYLFDRSAEMLTIVDGYSDVVGTVKQYIAEHYKEDIDRNDIAAVAYITPNYLSKRFHMEVGMSLREYINQLRIEEAKRLLLTTNSSVSDIAGEVGFDNISYFSTVFRKLCGMSPMDWRNHT